ncbi:nucleotidyl transferase AbiEii/AbiGii toxin family protein [Rhizohabitans arisaemae]|uniref:nucleotidyl transferase AbiEii/AbiGii toxin family protein n=1 Tax=Rhizohabitans arisaemae TaxID=2720610 RepID=UPI0024B12131|nr:nucleotidyl transferase AbiEii/AbiGii toxin family protein [Rhizohabitans arisaemae]
MMSRYPNAVALRRAIEDRLKAKANESGMDLMRLRRLLIFDRICARFAMTVPGRWVFKGGTVLEFRMPNRARTTKDIDLALRDGDLGDGELRDELIETLGADPDEDRFVFLVGTPTALHPDSGGRPGWRFGVQAELAGKPFGGVKLDIVARPEELTETEELRLPGFLDFAGVPPRFVEVVHPRQHFAEKLHALTRDYGDRPNTRVKDLLDLVLLIEDGLVPDAALVTACRHVFTVRATHDLPVQIGEPPPAWAGAYPGLAEGLTSIVLLPKALDLVRGYWETALDSAGGAGAVSGRGGG